MMTIAMLQIVASLTDNSRGIIYKCSILIIQVNAADPLKYLWCILFIS